MGRIYGCCLKRSTAGRVMWRFIISMDSTEQETRDGQKIISHSSASASGATAAGKSTMIFDVHWLSCSSSVQRKNGFLFFLISGSQTPFLTNSACRSCSFALSPAPSDLPLIFKYNGFFFSSICKNNIGRNTWPELLAAFPHRNCCDSRVLVLLPELSPSSSWAAGPTPQTLMSNTVTSLFLAHQRSDSYCCLQNFQGLYIQQNNDNLHGWSVFS